MNISNCRNPFTTQKPHQCLPINGYVPYASVSYLETNINESIFKDMACLTLY